MANPLSLYPIAMLSLLVRSCARNEAIVARVVDDKEETPQLTVLSTSKPIKIRKLVTLTQLFTYRSSRIFRVRPASRNFLSNVSCNAR